MTPGLVEEKAQQLKAALAASDDAPPEAALIMDLLVGMALNLAHLAHPAGESK